MKPDWSSAPEWANWWAIDEAHDGGFAEWGWYENEPVLIDTYEQAFWTSYGGGASFGYVGAHHDCEARKEERPKT